MKSANKVFKNTMFLYARMGITVFTSLYATRVILQALGVNDFGIFNLVSGLISMLIFLNSAMTLASQRYMSYAHGKGEIEEQKNIFNISILLHLFIGLLIILLLEGASLFLFDGILKIDPNRVEAAKMVYQFMVISTFFAIISVPYDAVINAHENMFFVAILGVFESFVKLGIAIYVAQYLGDKLIFYGFLMVFLSILIMTIKTVYSHKKYEEVQINPKKYFDISLFKKMSHFAGYSFLGTSSSMIAFYGQGLVLNMFFGTIVNAAQGIAGQVSGQLGAFAGTMLKALNPMIVKSEGAGDRQLMLKASFTGSKISFFLLIFFYVPVILEMPVIFEFWLGEVPEYAIVFCTLLLVRNLVEQLFLTLISSISAVGNIKYFQIYSSILSLSPLVVSYILFASGFSPFTLYVIYLLYSVLYGVLVLFYAKKECGMSIKSYFNDVIVKAVPPLLIILLIVLVPYSLVQVEPYRLLSVIIVNLFAFLPTVWFIGLTSREKEFVLSIVKKQLQKKKLT